MLLRVFLSAVIFLALSCSRGPSDRSPDGTLILFLDALGRSEWDPRALEEAYGLLSNDAKEALRHRAELASSLSGREFAPWEMLVQGRSRLRFGPVGGEAFEARIEGDRAFVTVRGASPEQKADVPMAREDGRWRVVLTIPPPGRRSGG